MKKIDELDEGQMAYRDTDGHLIILPLDDMEIREAFVTRLYQEFVDNRDVDKLLERFRQSALDAAQGNTKHPSDLKRQTEDKGE